MSTNRTGFVRESWPAAIAKGTAMFVVAVALLVVIPHRLVDYLAPKTTPTKRDLQVVVVWLIGLIACSWLFVTIQRDWRRVPTVVAGAVAGAGIGVLVDALGTWTSMPIVLGVIGALIGAGATFALTSTEPPPAATGADA